MLNICWFPFYWTNGWKEAQTQMISWISNNLVFSYRCGSVIVDLTLSFNTTVTEKRILNILKDAAKNGKLGNFNVDASSIKGTRPDILVATRPGIGKTTPKPPDGTILSKSVFFWHNLTMSYNYLKGPHVHLNTVLAIWGSCYLFTCIWGGGYME